MTRYQKFGIITVVAVVLLCLLSFMLPKDYDVRTKVKIEAPKNFSFNLINHLKYQAQWNAKAILDSTFSTSEAATAMGNGAFVDYKSNMYGDGSIHIKYTNGNDSIAISDGPTEKALRFFEFKCADLQGGLSEVAVHAQSTSGFISNLWNFLHRWKLQKQVDQSLSIIKQIAEDRYIRKMYNGYEIKQKAMNHKYFITQRSDVSFENMAQFYTQNISALYQKALANNITTNGMPCALFYQWDEKNKKTNMAAALPTLIETNLKDTEAVTLEPKLALMIAYKGPNSQSGKAHLAIDDYMLDFNLKNDVPIMEEYMTDPASGTAPQEWLTNIYYYIKTP